MPQAGANRRSTPQEIITLIGLALVTASVLLFFHALYPADTWTAALLGRDASSVVRILSFLTGGACGLCAMCLVGNRHPADTVMLVISAVMGLFGIVCSLFEDSLAVGGVAGACVSSALGGWGMVALGTSRGAAACASSSRLALLSVSLAAGAALSIAVRASLDGAAYFAAWVCIWVAGSLCVVCLRAPEVGEPARSDAVPASRPEIHSLAEAIDSDERFSTAALSERDALPGRKRAGWAFALALLGVCISSLVASICLEGLLTAQKGSPISHEVCLAVSCALVCVPSLLDRSVKRDRTVKLVLLPVACVLMLSDPFLTLPDARLTTMSGVIWTGCLLVIFAIAWSQAQELACSWSAAGSGARWLAAPALALASWLAGMFAGSLLQATLGRSNLVLLSCALILAYLVALLVTIVTSLARERREGAPDPSQSAAAMTTRLEDFARAQGLSQRETEVFLLLAQGRGEAHISSELSISPNTVKYHRQNIYQKLSCSSREELLDLVQSVMK